MVFYCGIISISGTIVVYSKDLLPSIGKTCTCPRLVLVASVVALREGMNGAPIDVSELHSRRTKSSPNLQALPK